MKILALITSLIISASVLAEDLSQIKFELLLAKRGDLSAQLRVASAFEYGNDVKKNLKEALVWYIKAANQSHAPSQYKVGYFYENALGVAKNTDTAMSWYKKAKANGSDEASKRLDKTAFNKSKKEKQAQRAVLQEKLEKEEKARATIERENAKAAVKKAAKAKKLAKKRALAKKQALAKKKTQKASSKKILKKAAPKKVIVTKKKTKAVHIPKMIKHVLKNKWKNQHGASDYLPSGSTSCLESGDNELTCFSSEKSRKIKGSNITYTAKSTLFGFKSNGSFKVVYNYNGVAISGAKSNNSDMYGLVLKEGWQEPALAIKCLASDRKNLTCFRGSKQVKFNY